MPSYELALILRNMARPQTATVLKRTSLKILENNGILFGIENLGTRSLPYSVSKHGQINRAGSYFVFKFDASPISIAELKAECERDLDVIKIGFTRVKIPEEHECQLEEESKPAAYREDVKQMILEGRKRERIFNFKTGLKYNPFRT